MDWPLMLQQTDDAIRDSWRWALPQLQAMTRENWLLVLIVVLAVLYFRAKIARAYWQGHRDGRDVGFADAQDLLDDEDDDDEDDLPTFTSTTQTAAELPGYADAALQTNRQMLRDVTSAQTELLSRMAGHLMSEQGEMREAVLSLLSDASETTANEVAQAANAMRFTSEEASRGMRDALSKLADGFNREASRSFTQDDLISLAEKLKRYTEGEDDLGDLNLQDDEDDEDDED